MTFIALAGIVGTAGGCLCLYLSADNQRWLRAPWRARPARIAGSALLGLGWLGLAQHMQRVTASFVFVTVAMLAFVAFPYIGAWVHARRSR